MIIFLFWQAIRLRPQVPTTFLQVVILISVLFSKLLRCYLDFFHMYATQQPTCNPHESLFLYLFFRTYGMLLMVKFVYAKFKGKLGVYKQFIGYFLKLFPLRYIHIFQIPGTSFLSSGQKAWSSFTPLWCVLSTIACGAK